MTVGEIEVQPALLILGLGSAVLLILLRGRRHCRGTTLLAPMNWATVSVALIMAASWFVGESSRGLTGLHREAIWYAVACSTFCPQMAVLGAKRPQDRGWQWVVLTLWVILVWPAIQALALPAGPRLELFPAWKLFLIALVGLGLLNYFPTRHWLASLLVAAGQCVLLGEHFGFTLDKIWSASIALGFFLSAAWIMLPWQTSCERMRGIDAHTQRWLRFRDAYGAFWGLRILQRINETATLRQWSVRLAWSGFESTAENQLPQSSERESSEIEQTLDTLLRRFF